MARTQEIDDLRRFLLDLSHNLSHVMSKETRKLIHKTLFLTITKGGKYLNWFFPLSSEGGFNAEISVEEMYDWSLSNYYSEISKKYSNIKRDHSAIHSCLPCAQIFRKGEPIYKCLTCGFDDTCALCHNCFQPEHHEGHTVYISICVRDNGGVCDCRDPEAWVQQFNCIHADEDDEFSELRNAVIPEDFENQFRTTLEALLDFIIDIMSQSDLQLHQLNLQPNEITMVAENCNLSPKKYGYSSSPTKYDVPSEKYSLIAYNDQVHHLRDAVQRIHSASKKVPEFAAMVAQRIQTHGRGVVLRTKDLSLLCERQKLLNATGLSSCIRNSRDEFREEMCLEILSWLESITRSDVFKANTGIQDLFCRTFCSPWSNGLQAQFSMHSNDYQCGYLNRDFGIPETTIASALPSFWEGEANTWEDIETLNQRFAFDTKREDCIHPGSRFQYLVYLDVRFWKALRSPLHTMYATSLITNLRWKNVLCWQYVDIYSFVSDMFLTLDGEPENNVMCTLSCQLFICPSNSTALLAHGNILQILGTIYSFLTKGEASAIPEKTNRLLFLSLKNRRWGQIFFDTGYVLSRAQHRNIEITKLAIEKACDILCLFQGKPTIKREKKNHIEYESSEYTAFFHAILVIYQFADSMAQSIKNFSDLKTRNLMFEFAIQHLTNQLLILESTSLEQNILDYENDSGKQCVTPDYILKEGDKKESVSFLHPMHSLLSWLIEYAHFDNKDSFLELLDPLFDTHQGSMNQIFQYPLQAIVLCSQIKAGYWVRNGFSAKNQCQLYRSTGLREQGFYRDIFLLQVFFVCQGHEEAVAYCLDKWLLDERRWLDTNPAYEASIFPYILEECLTFFINILNEDLNLRGLSSEEISRERIKKEIIHHLCFGSMSYSKLCSQIPDHVSSEKRFDMILDDLAIYKEPKSSNDSGTYTLKDQYLDQVNPFYQDYSTNKREDAVKLIKERIKSRHTESPAEIVIEPPLKDRKDYGLFKTLGNFTGADQFVGFLTRSILFVTSDDPNKHESLFDTLLHLIHLCTKEVFLQPRDEICFLKKILLPNKNFQKSLVSLLYYTLIDDRFKCHHAKIKAILLSLSVDPAASILILEDSIPNFDAARVVNPCTQYEFENEVERKKRVAKNRQAKLLMKFKKQQSLFLQRNEFSNSESDDEMRDSEEEGWCFPEPRCILCQDSAAEAGPFGIIAHISKFSAFREISTDDDYWFFESFSGPSDLCPQERTDCSDVFSQSWMNYFSKMKETRVVGPGYPKQHHLQNKHVSLTCGHGMHLNCYREYVYENRSRSSHITRNVPDSIERREFLCPLCKSINNLFIPILWSNNNRCFKSNICLKGNTHAFPFDDFDDIEIHDPQWFLTFRTRSFEDIKLNSILSTSAKEMIGLDYEDSTSREQQEFKALMTDLLQALSFLTFPKVFRADSTDLLTNSIKATEISTRGQKSTSGILLDHISNTALINLRTINEFRRLSYLMRSSSWDQALGTTHDIYVRLLANISSLSIQNFPKSILGLDFFETMLSIMPLPSLGITFNSILRACFLGHIIQTIHILAAKFAKHGIFERSEMKFCDLPFISFTSEKDTKSTLLCFRSILRVINQDDYEMSLPEDSIFGSRIYCMILKCITPFLRQALIYAFANFADLEGVHVDELRGIPIEADRICQMLQIPCLSDILQRMVLTENRISSPEFERFESFLSFLKRQSPRDSLDNKQQLAYPNLLRLINLPYRLDQFFTDYFYLPKFGYPHKFLDSPAVCLYCAEIMDAQKQVLGNKFGQCTLHLINECPHSVGIFLLPKDRTLLLLHRNGGSFHESPYLDAHFEVPNENKKNKAVYLLEQKYEDLTRRLWLQHQSLNYIVRKLDSVVDAGGWETL